MYTYYNDEEKKIHERLKQETEIPAIVHDRVNKAYRMIENRRVVQTSVPCVRFRRLKTCCRIAGGAAAVLAAGFLLCVTNPVMAKDLPLVGGLFEKLQDKVSFFGNFSDRAENLEESPAQSADAALSDADSSGRTAPVSGNVVSQTDPEAEETASPDTSDGAYTRTDNGLTVSFSEIYANDQAIYLTMSLRTEDSFPETMTGQDGKPIISMIASAGFDFKQKNGEFYSPDIQYYNLEGAFLDSNTYSCILRIDLADAARDFTEYNEQYDILTQNILDEMGITLDDLNDETEEGMALLTEFNDKIMERSGALQSYIKTIEIPDSFLLSFDITEVQGDMPYEDPGSGENVNSEIPVYTFKGNWNFEIPVTIDASQTVTLEINETNENGIGLKSVVKTPYELTVYELYEEGSDSDCFMVALDAEGNKLPYNESSGSTNNFAVQDRDISTVDIYILDYIQYMDELKGEENYNNNENKPEGEKWSDLLDQYAKYHKTVHFEQ